MHGFPFGFSQRFPFPLYSLFSQRQSARSIQYVNQVTLRLCSIPKGAPWFAQAECQVFTRDEEMLPGRALTTSLNSSPTLLQGMGSSIQSPQPPCHCSRLQHFLSPLPGMFFGWLQDLTTNFTPLFKYYIIIRLFFLFLFFSFLSLKKRSLVDLCGLPW